MIVNVSKAREQLSKLVDMAYHGRKVTIAKNNRPLVDLVPHKSAGRRKLGTFRGQIEMSEDFLAENEEINRMFYGTDSPP
jgi:prevent-host-death family protein